MASINDPMLEVMGLKRELSVLERLRARLESRKHDKATAKRRKRNKIAAASRRGNR